MFRSLGYVRNQKSILMKAFGRSSNPELALSRTSADWQYAWASVSIGPGSRDSSTTHIQQDRNGANDRRGHIGVWNELQPLQSRRRGFVQHSAQCSPERSHRLLMRKVVIPLRHLELRLHIAPQRQTPDSPVAVGLAAAARLRLGLEAPHRRRKHLVPEAHVVDSARRRPRQRDSGDLQHQRSCARRETLAGHHEAALARIVVEGAGIERRVVLRHSVLHKVHGRRVQRERLGGRHFIGGRNSLHGD